jgi:translation initiation factor IF-3
LEKILVNKQIKAEKVRVIDEEGKNLGIFSLEEALKIAKEKNFDLVQVSDKADPPVCKLIDYGKYLYWLQKKKKVQQKESKVKIIRLSFNISPHDLDTKANQVEKFLKEGNKVKIEMLLRGREKGLENFAKEKILKFLEILKEKVKIKTEGELKKEPKGFTIIVIKEKNGQSEN